MKVDTPLVRVLGNHEYKDSLFHLNAKETEQALTGRRLYRATCGCGGNLEQVDVTGFPPPEHVEGTIADFGVSLVKLACVSCSKAVYLELLTSQRTSVQIAREALKKNVR